MNDGKTSPDFKYFLIVLTRNGWNVFATKSHSREFKALELFKIGERESFYKVVAKISALKQWKVRKVEMNLFVLVLSNVEDLISKSWIMRNLIMYVCTCIHTIELFKWNNKIILNKEQVEFRFRELSALIVWICIPMCIHIFSFILLKCTIRNTGTSAFTDGLLILQLDWWQSSVQRCRVHDKNFICDGGWVVVLKFFQRGHLLSSDMNFELRAVSSCTKYSAKSQKNDETAVIVYHHRRL